MTTHPSKTPHHSPRRAQHRPKLFHLRHHTEPDGTVHTLCGLTITPKAATHGARASQGRIQCPACDAARYLSEIDL